MVAPIRVWGNDSTGKVFNVLAHTLDVSSSGARIGGIRVSLGVGDAVTIQYKQQKALYKVAWVGRPGDKTQDQLGVALLEPERQIWAELRESPQFTDDYRGNRKVPVQQGPIEAPPPPPSPAAIQEAERVTEEIVAETEAPPAATETDNIIDVDGVVTRCAAGLLRIEQLVKRKPPSATALNEFRDALAKLRQTVWAMQQWYEVKDETRKAFPLLAFLNTERLRFVVQATQDLADDMVNKQVELDRDLLKKLYRSVDQLRAADASSGAEGQGFSFEVSPPADRAGDVRAVAIEVQRSGMDAETGLDFFAGELQRILGASGAAVAALQDGEMVCVAASGNMPGPGMVLETEQGPGAEALANLIIVNCRDTQSDPRVDAELCRAANILSVVFVPVLSEEGAPVGLIEAVADRPNVFDSERTTALHAAIGVARDLLARHRAAGD
ncbi:MAG: GAF domain-containing protein [Terriglobales bacterium]